MYKEIIQENPYGENLKVIIRDNGDGTFTSFPADPENPNYIALMALVAEGKLTIGAAQ
jgi:phosphomannomutase